MDIQQDISTSSSKNRRTCDLPIGLYFSLVPRPIFHYWTPGEKYVFFACHSMLAKNRPGDEASCTCSVVMISYL